MFPAINKEGWTSDSTLMKEVSYFYATQPLLHDVMTAHTPVENRQENLNLCFRRRQNI
jgi:hypothetical protein